MKPIRLEVKGLNSFIDKQVVDFEKLTECGLFGIFGPTGSGKSTVLDGITLALYGGVARDSSNFINTNCNSVYVSFEFQITEKTPKKYKVEREIRRKKDGGTTTKLARILEIKEADEVVLEDKATKVKSKCEEIIGLKLDDFMRTVVLPQGKFSEFLKLEGKERRNMLERLFNLRKYGDDLSSKLNSEIRKEKDKMNVLEGQLKGYEGISEEALKDKWDKIEELNLNIKEEEESLDKIKKDFEEAKNIWNTQLELNKEKKSEEILLEKAEEIKNKDAIREAGERAFRVALFIDNFEEILKDLEIEEKRLLELKNKLAELEISKKEYNKKFEDIKNKKEEVLPTLNINKEKLSEANKEKNLLKDILDEGKVLKRKCLTMEKEIILKSETLKEYESKERGLKSDLQKEEGRIEEFFVEEIFKEKVNDAVFLLRDFEGFENQKNKLVEEQKILVSEIKENTITKEKLKSNLDSNNKKLKEKIEALEKLVEECPGDRNKILEMQIEVSKYEERLNKYKELKNNLKNSIDKKNNFEEKLKVFSREKLSLENDFNELKDYVKKAEVEELAYRLREDLIQGEPCPVCGGTHHQLENVEKVNLELSKEKRDLLESKEKNLRNLTIEFSKVENSLENENKNIETFNFELEKLGEFSEENLSFLKENFNKLKENLKNYEENKIDLEKEIEELKEAKHKLEQELNGCEVVLGQKIVRKAELEKKLEELNEELDNNKNSLDKIKRELNISDIKVESEKITKKEKEREILRKSIDKSRSELDKISSIKEALRKEIDKLNDDYRKEQTALETKREVYKEKSRMIRDYLKGIVDYEHIENLNFKELLDETLKNISEIERVYKECEINKEDIEKAYLEVEQQVRVSSEKIKGLEERKVKATNNLNTSLENEKFNSVEEAKNSLLSKDEIDEIKGLVEEYNNSLIKVRGNLELLINKLDGNSLSEEEWNDIKVKKENKESLLKEIQEEKIKFSTELENIKKKLEEQREVLYIKAKQEHKLALLSDLDKLFKGKRFVEFIAANQLKYISIEASKKLKDITNGVYGLEVDENGKFFIRDYKNGGASRDASTLSGGETFLASLALALALSSQIQLKGSAPLELFFLDEGFGTLDDNLLDVVMGSLERLHHDRLSVGIISHVEAIKNRVPLKLVLTPAESGKGGSKVKIERS